MKTRIIKLYPRLRTPRRRPIPSGGQAEVPGLQGQTDASRPLEYGCSRLCRHVLSGRIRTPKLCMRNDECYHCAFDQMLDEYDRAANDDTFAGRTDSLYRTA